MTREDELRLREVAARLPTLEPLALLSPGKQERRIFRRGRPLFRGDWDLHQRHAGRFELIVACNVFMYAPDPALWLGNVLASTSYLLLSEPMRRQRGPSGELGPDGDAARFMAPGLRGAAPGAFDLGRLGTRLLGARSFDGGANEHGPALHVQALLQGELADDLTAAQRVARAALGL